VASSDFADTLLCFLIACRFNFLRASDAACLLRRVCQ
jgi:hypothetical protein